MKTITKLLLIFTTAVSLAGCDEFLNQPPIGGSLIQEQYDQLGNKLEGSMRGVYSMMYAVSSTENFGQRSIDMYGDLLCSDMALTDESYGWFMYDERQLTREYRSGYLWSHFYGMLRNINMVISTVKTQTTFWDNLNKYGMPTDGLNVLDESGNVIYHYNEQDSLSAIYYAQALTMRGYVYSSLVRFFVPTVDHLFNGGYNLTNYPCFPVYTEANMNDGAQPLAMLNEVYTLIDQDLTSAISVFDAFGKEYEGASKLEVDINVARGILAYYYLNRAREINVGASNPLLEMPMRKALTYADQVIQAHEHEIIPNRSVLTTGFNNIEDKSWMWGQNVTVETTGGLASFQGHVDIHSYSYAWVGGTKAIDKHLYDEIPAWDVRKLWFNDGKANSTYALCPDKKYFSSKNPTSTATDNIDREWLSDNVFMRIELMYLIASEACYFLEDLDSAAMYLTAITDERINLQDSMAADKYATYRASLSTDEEEFIKALILNWRVELWGEGYGLQTFRRLTCHKYKYYNEETKTVEEKVRRGANHAYDKGAEIAYDDETKYTMQIPASETNYNPHLGD